MAAHHGIARRHQGRDMSDKYSFLVIKYPKPETAESALAVL
jgi:hypothetical protein